LLDRLKELNPDYRNPNAHLLYARALENLDATDSALHEYEALHEYFSGPEASFHYARYLKSLGRQIEAKKIFDEILNQADLSGRLYLSMHKDIIQKVKSELRVLD